MPGSMFCNAEEPTVHTDQSQKSTELFASLWLVQFWRQNDRQSHGDATGTQPKEGKFNYLCKDTGDTLVESILLSPDCQTGWKNDYKAYWWETWKWRTFKSTEATVGPTEGLSHHVWLPLRKFQERKFRNQIFHREIETGLWQLCDTFLMRICVNVNMCKCEFV